jgi:hypothetical protein
MNLETLLLILQILIFIGIIAIGYLAKSLTGYVTEKGKNQATREDIQEITEKVEGVKASLTIIAQQQLNLIVKRNEALTQFFEDSFTVLNLLRTGQRIEKLDEFDRLIKETKDCIVRAIASHHRLTLYVQEESILTPARKARKALEVSLTTWWRLVNKFRDAFANLVKEELELAKNPDGKPSSDQSNNDTPAAQSFEELQKGNYKIAKMLNESLKEYGIALNAHLHSVDKSKALTATTGTQSLSEERASKKNGGAHQI